jgi:phosphoglycolate phosphatase-like HAD superfamily hydrolase
VLGDVHTHGKTDRQVVHEYLASAGTGLEDAARVMEALDVISVRYDADGGRIPVLDGVDETLARLGGLGYVNGLLTGNTPARAINKLRGAGVDVTRIAWDQSFFGANAPLRGDVTRAARRRYPERPIVIIGDTPLDGAAAEEAGLAFIGVTTGVYEEPALRAAGAVAVVENLVVGAAALDAALRSLAA